MSGHKRKTSDLPLISNDSRSDSPCLSSHKLIKYSTSSDDSGCSSGCCYIIPSTPIEELENKSERVSNNDITPIHITDFHNIPSAPMPEPKDEPTGYDYIASDGQHKKYRGKLYGSIILHLTNGVDYACDFSDIVFPLSQLQNTQHPTAYRIISGVPLMFIGEINLDVDVKTINAYRQLCNMRITTQTITCLMDVWIFIKTYSRAVPTWFYDVIKLILKTKLPDGDHSDIHEMLNPANIETAITAMYRKLWIGSISQMG